MDESYRDIEFELYGNLVQIRNILSYYETQDEILGSIDKGIAQIKSKMYNVAVVGEFRRGKSSLINALLGLDVLPSDVTPTTATINRITFGTEPKVLIYFKDGRTQEVSVSELQSYVTKITEENEKTALSIREAVIYYPTVICQNHVDIIDTPGLNDDEDMTRTTIGMLSNIDAVIVAVSALSPYSETEKNFVAQLIGTKEIHNIIFVVTFIDQIDEDELPKLLQGIKKRITDMTRLELKVRFEGQPELLKKGDLLLDDSNMKIFGISAKQALKSFAANDRKLLQRSRFVAFKEDLYKILTAQQSSTIVEKTSALINTASKRFDTIYKDKFDVITGEISRLKTGLEQTAMYYDGEAALLESYRREHQTRLTELSAKAGSAFGALVALFVAELAKVKINDAAVIQNAITAGKAAADAAARDMAEQDYRVVTGLFLSMGQQLAERREALLLRHSADDIPVKPQTTEQFFKSFEDRLLHLHKLSFAFSGDFVPKCDNLAHFNVIAHIRETVSPMLNAYQAELSGYIEACWSVCYGFIAGDDGLRDGLMAAMTEALHKAETDMLVCQSNYQLHKRMVENLVRRTDELMATFEQRGVNG